MRSRPDIGRIVAWGVIGVLPPALLALGVVAQDRASTATSIPAVDLLRIAFPTEGVDVEEHGAERLEIATDGWTLSVNALDSWAADKLAHAMRSNSSAIPGYREEVLDAPPGGPEIRRFLVQATGPQAAAHASYFVSLDGARLLASAGNREPGEPFDVGPVDRLLLAFRLEAGPRPDAEVLPAWRVYQADRRPHAPIAKFILYMDPAPVVLGDEEAADRDLTTSDDADFRRGGRRIAPGLFEFYAKGDPTSIRVDLWLEDPPRAEDREPVFETTIDVGDHPFMVRSFDLTYHAPVPPGEYVATVGRVHPGRAEDRALTDREWFDRDDLERYEVVLRPRP